jgi:hypothetical protein
MIITVIIENQSFEIDCDTGTQDVAWLALCACSLYGQNTYPITTYLPIMAKNQSGTILPPKTVIVKNMELIGEKVYVDVRKKAKEVNSELTDKQKEWYNDAFLEGRFKMTVTVKLKPSGDIRKDNKFKVVFNYEILPKIAMFFPQYGDTVEVEMKSTSKGRKDYNLEGEIKIPFGKLKQKKILFCQKTADVYDKETSDFTKNELSFTTSNEILSDDDKEKYLRMKEELIRDKEIKIKQNIIDAEKEKKEQEERFEQLKKYMTQIPFTLEEVYQYVKEQIDMNDQDLVEIFELLERNEYFVFRKLFEIFFDYCQFYENNTDLTVDSIAVLNFLNLFFRNNKNVQKIGEEFENLYISRLERDGTQIDFKEFIYIIIFLLYNIMIHSQINICHEIENIPKKYAVFLEMEAYEAMNKNKEIVTLLNVHFRPIKKIFNKYAIKKDNSEPMEMTAEKFYNFFADVANLCKYDLIKLNKGDVKTEYNIDIFDFLRKIVGMALNLTVKPEKDEEDNTNEEKRDLEYIGLNQEQAVEKFIGDIIQKFKEKDMKEAKEKKK